MKKPTYSLELRSKFWSYCFYWQDKRYRGSTKKSRRDEAQAFVEAEILRVMSQTMIDGLLPSEMLPQQFVDAYFEKFNKKQRAKLTADNYKIYGKRFVDYFKGKPIGEIKPTDIEDWKHWLLEQDYLREPKGKLHPKTVAYHIDWLSAVYKMFRLPSPCIGVERPKISHIEEVDSLKYYSSEEINILRAKTAELAGRESLKRTEAKVEGKHLYRENDNTWELFMLAFQVLVYTGMRVGELRQIRYKDLDWDNNRLMVRGEKTKRARPLPLGGSKSMKRLASFFVRLFELSLEHYGLLEEYKSMKRKDFIKKHGNQLLP